MGRVGEPYATDTLLQLLHTSNPDVAGHETDMLLCCGEIISACVFAAELQRAGFPAMAMTGGQAGIETDDTYGSAHLLHVDPRPAMKVMAQGIIPVICGFQGATRPDGQMTTLGRGGSDTSAAALGVGLKASAVEIYTDVDGIMTADPRMVEHPRIMSQISYGACCELAEQGAKVIHQRAVEIAQEGNIPLYVKCTFDDTPGTLITNVGSVAERVSVEPRSFVNGITYIRDLTQYPRYPERRQGRAGIIPGPGRRGHQRQLPESVPDGIHVLRLQRQGEGLCGRPESERFPVPAERPLRQGFGGRHFRARHAGPHGILRQCLEREGNRDLADRRFQYIYFGYYQRKSPERCGCLPARSIRAESVSELRIRQNRSKKERST
jgi:hypothetical protein